MSVAGEGGEARGPAPGGATPGGSVRRYRRNLRSEVDSAYLYETLAAAEDDGRLSALYRRLAGAERRHADFWKRRLAEAGAPPGSLRPSWRARVLGWAARRFGSAFVLPTITGLESSGSSEYLAQPESSGTSMPAQEASHRRLLQELLAGSPAGLPGPAIARLEGRHRSVGGNALRAAVLGANDGLLSNLSLVMGVAGASLPTGSVLLTGVAGLLAGALSMALGEWLSVQSSRELYGRQIAVEAAELAAAPEEEGEELALIYEARGLPPDAARELAARLLSDRRTALDALSREELGIDPGELGGSPWEAAATSFFLFSVGAAIPVVGFAVLPAGWAVPGSVAMSVVALFAIGAATTLMTGRGVLFSGARQVLFGLAAAAVTFGTGRLLGVSLSG